MIIGNLMIQQEKRMDTMQDNLEGPLTDFESWMPDFMGGLAEGIEKSRGLVKDAGGCGSG